MSARRAHWIATLGLCLSAAACASGGGAHSDAAYDYANFLVGRMADLRDDHHAASERLFETLQRAPRDEALYEDAMEASLAAGDFDRAGQIARMASARRVHVAYADLYLGVEDLRAGRWDGARTRLNAVRGGGAEQLLARALVGWADAGDGDAAAQAEALGRLNISRPYSAVFEYQRAMLLEMAGDLDAARAAYEEAGRQGLWLPPALERHAGLLERAGARDAALEILDPNGLAGANPAMAAARARVLADGAAAPEPLSATRGAAISLYGLGTIFLREHDYADGMATLSLARALDPDFDAVKVSFAQAEIDLGHVEAARAVLASVRPDSPYASTAGTMQAWVLLDQGDEAGALSLAREAARGGDRRAERALADLYRATAHYREAEPIYTRLIETPEGAQPDWRLYFARGAVRERLGRLAQSEEDMREALRLSPDQPDVLNYLGYTLVDRTSRVEEGMDLIRRAVTLRPMSGAIIDSLGWAYFKQGDYQNALELLERAIELEPADPTLNDHLGDVYWRLGRRIEARYQWRRALTLDPPEADRQALESKLERGLTAAALVRPPTP